MERVGKRQGHWFTDRDTDQESRRRRQQIPVVQQQSEPSSQALSTKFAKGTPAKKSNFTGIEPDSFWYGHSDSVSLFNPWSWKARRRCAALAPSRLACMFCFSAAFLDGVKQTTCAARCCGDLALKMPREVSTFTWGKFFYFSHPKVDPGLVSALQAP